MKYELKHSLVSVRQLEVTRKTMTSFFCGFFLFFYDVATNEDLNTDTEMGQVKKKLKTMNLKRFAYLSVRQAEKRQ